MKARPNRQKDKQPAGPATLSVRVQPRARRNEIVKMEGGGFKIRLTAPPVDGAANEALIRFLANTLSLPKSQIEVISGHASREKIVRISGADKSAIETMLNNAGK